MRVIAAQTFFDSLERFSSWWYKLDTAWYTFKYFAFKRDAWRYVPTPRLEPGYVCQDTRILHACMQMVVDYVDESSLEDLAWRCDPKTYADMGEELAAKRAADFTEVRRIYDYWVSGRDALDAERDAAWAAYTESVKTQFVPVEGSDPEYYEFVSEPAEGYTADEVEELRKKAFSAEALCEETEDAMMASLVRVRRLLWV